MFINTLLKIQSNNFLPMKSVTMSKEFQHGKLQIDVYKGKFIKHKTCTSKLLISNWKILTLNYNTYNIGPIS